MEKKLNFISKGEFKKLEKNIFEVKKDLIGRIDKIDTKIDKIEKCLNTKIDEVEKRLNKRINEVEKGLNTRIDEVEKRLNTRIDEVEKNLNARIDEVEKSLNARIDEVEKSLNARIDEVEKRLNDKIEGVEKRLDEKINRVGLEVIKHTQMFEEIKNNMLTKDVYNILDEIVRTVRKLDQERVFTIEWIERIEKQVKKNTDDIKKIKEKIGME